MKSIEDTRTATAELVPSLIKMNMTVKKHNLRACLPVLLLAVVTLVFSTARADEKIRIMTFNVPKGNIPAEGLNTWANRAASICTFLRESQPDLLGMQEPVVSELTDILSGLDGYTMIGVARDDGSQSGEYSPIIYRTARFIVEQSGTYWLSLTPDEVSKSWESACNRIATWAIFRDKHTGARFLYTNTHLDHVSSEARYNQMRVIKEHMQETLSSAGDMPAFLTGDFNSTGTEENSPVEQAKTYLVPMNDTYLVAETKHGVTYTFPSSKLKIDYIMGTKGVSVSDAWIHNSYYSNGQIISDHNALYADLSWPLSVEERADSLARVANSCIDSLTMWNTTSAKLLSASMFSGDGIQSGSSYSNLTDAISASTYYSAYSAPLPPAGTHYIQVDLKRNDVGAFVVSLMRSALNAALKHTPEEIRIYASADTVAWQYVTDISPIEFSSNGRFNSPVVVMPQGARYVRLYVTQTDAMDIVVSGPRFALGGLNLLRCNIDTARSQCFYDTDIARAADNLATACAAAKSAPSDSSVNALADALQTLRGLCIPVGIYEALVDEAENMETTHTVGSEIGQTTAEAAEKYKNGLADVKESVPAGSSKAVYESAIEELHSLIDEFENSFVGPEEGKWYYLVNHERIVTGTMRNRTIYADSIDSSAPLKVEIKNNAGLTLAGSASPYAMWRFEKAGDGNEYTLQNRGTGFYIGMTMQGEDSCYVSSTEPVKYSLKYPAVGELSLLSPSGNGLSLAATSKGCLYNSASQGASSATSWILRPVDDSMDSIEVPVKQNSISIVCFPFPVVGVSLANPSMKAYTLSYIPPLVPTIHLARKDTFAAGEPFILMAGVPAAEGDSDAGTVMMRIPASDDIVTSAGSVGGLHGTLDKSSVPSSLYFEDNILRNHTSVSQMDGQKGYIVRSEASSSGAVSDLSINVNTLVNAIHSAHVSRDGSSAVYTVDGVRVYNKKQLPSGIYIIDGKKVLVR